MRTERDRLKGRRAKLIQSVFMKYIFVGEIVAFSVRINLLEMKDAEKIIRRTVSLSQEVSGLFLTF